MYEWGFFDSKEELHPLEDADNLYAAFLAARRGSQWKAQVQRFRWNAMTEIRKLQRELQAFRNGAEDGYRLSQYSRFTVHERGKTRAITALNVRDRTVKHALNDLYLIPHIRPNLIYDNGASLKDKGVSFTRNRLTAHLESFFRERGGNDGYIMTMDFSGYYDNIDHALAKQMITAWEPDEFARQLTFQAYDSFRVDVSYMSEEEYRRAQQEKFSMVEYRKETRLQTGEKFLCRSMSVGDQTSQITAIAYATPIDKLVTIVNGFRYYGRYMDDLYVIAGTKEELEEIRQKIEDMAKRLRLFLNPRKTKIQKVSGTFRFLQYRYRLTERGHVVIRINPKTVTRMRRKLKKLKGLIQSGGTTKEKAEELFRTWIANYREILSRKQRENIIKLYRQLFGGGTDEWMKTRGFISP